MVNDHLVDCLRYQEIRVFQVPNSDGMAVR